MTNTTIGGSAGLVSTGIGQAPRIVKISLDIADVASTVTTGGLVKYILPADTYFQFLNATARTALSLDSASSGRVDIGDQDDDDQYVTNQTTYTAGTRFTIASGGNTHSDGLVVAAADFLAVKLTGDKLAGGTANATGIIDITILVGGCGSVPYMTVQD